MGLFLFGDDGPMLGQAEVDGACQLLLLAWLGQKPENVAFVDRGDGRVEVGKAGEQHSYRVRRFSSHSSQELGAVHARHAHVGDDDCEWSIFLGHGQPFFPALGCAD